MAVYFGNKASGSLLRSSRVRDSGPIRHPLGVAQGTLVRYGRIWRAWNGWARDAGGGSA
jgi:hypothetical protein